VSESNASVSTYQVAGARTAILTGALPYSNMTSQTSYEKPHKIENSEDAESGWGSPQGW
jgi:hypothetical protein